MATAPIGTHETKQLLDAAESNFNKLLISNAKKRRLATFIVDSPNMAVADVINRGQDTFVKKLKIQHDVPRNTAFLTQLAEKNPDVLHFAAKDEGVKILATIHKGFERGWSPARIEQKVQATVARLTQKAAKLGDVVINGVKTELKPLAGKLTSAAGNGWATTIASGATEAVKIVR